MGYLADAALSASPSYQLTPFLSSAWRPGEAFEVGAGVEDLLVGDAARSRQQPGVAPANDEAAETCAASAASAAVHSRLSNGRGDSANLQCSFARRLGGTVTRATMDVGRQRGTVPGAGYRGIGPTDVSPC
jgi:hypothetical protein